ncbi:MAG: beta-ketoacyl-ACP synthase III [Verrucomicrobiota bacterium]|jgi:3-oxoacyl-[acyl-carrier-protein] synthase-3|nr:3-oxoacyl-ACP synthase [Opitutae bacterium]MEC7626845.1 beta-ketoacyl-ACP synthase III [Verrucomicrobiota bacterium]MEC8865027.1 beta-ketoacyl-ACP synthase III [Verrucomicrobiota bacterium]MED5281814.1 beta-ketoacyl-ACP synthase III [Verrucomicrobiota bacterium]MEE3060220.1 beta-ketoacyl-ACP synthase III [Verrucomicrobiota bacterium]
MSNPNPTYVLGMGSYVPSNKVDNHALSLRVDTSDEWIRSRTGIRERCLAEDDQACSDLALEASVRALKDADIERDQIDLVIVATITPDMSFPSTACLLQHKLGLGKISSFDLEAACSGFLYALDVADGMLASNRYHNALVVGAEKMSSILDWDDRTTCVLFGDGAGAAVLSKKGAGHELLGFQCGADGSDPTVLHKPAGGSLLPASQDTLNERKHFLKMNGREIFKSAVRVMERAVRELLEKHEISMDEVDHVIPHQANVRIVESLAQRLEISMDKFFCNLENYGNTSAASVPLALDEGRALGRFRSGQLGVLVAFGAGLTWSATLIRF